MKKKITTVLLLSLNLFLIIEIVQHLLLSLEMMQVSNVQKISQLGHLVGYSFMSRWIILGASYLGQTLTAFSFSKILFLITVYATKLYQFLFIFIFLCILAIRRDKAVIQNIYYYIYYGVTTIIATLLFFTFLTLGMSNGDVNQIISTFKTGGTIVFIVQIIFAAIMVHNSIKLYKTFKTI